MGGEFIDGNFVTTLDYCGRLGLDIDCTPGWSLGEKGEMDYASSYRINADVVHTQEGLSDKTREYLAAFEELLTFLGKQFLVECTILEQDKYPIVIVEESDDAPDCHTIQLSPGVTVTFYGQKTTLKHAHYLSLKPFDAWPHELGNVKKWKSESALAWLDANWPYDSSNADLTLAREIWSNSMAGEYGNVAEIGLAFITHQNAIDQFEWTAGLSPEQSMGLHECMRVKEGNQEIANRMECIVNDHMGSRVLCDRTVTKIKAQENQWEVSWNGPTKQESASDVFPPICMGRWILSIPNLLRMCLMRSIRKSIMESMAKWR